MNNYPILSPIPAHYRRVMVFDTETTGLLPKYDPVTKQAPDIAQYPHIIQLSYMIWNLTTQRTEEIYNAYVRIPEHVELSPKITEITGITRDLCDTRGVPIEEVMGRFCTAYAKCQIIVAHNIDFDKEMVLAELARLKSDNPVFLDEYNHTHKIDLYCTMRASTNVCNLMRESPSKYPGGKPYQYKKAPKLSELYEFLFGETPKHLHNAIVDVSICLRCFLKLRCCIEVPKNRWNRLLSTALDTAEISHAFTK